MIKANKVWTDTQSWTLDVACICPALFGFEENSFPNLLQPSNLLMYFTSQNLNYTILTPHPFHNMKGYCLILIPEGQVI